MAARRTLSTIVERRRLDVGRTAFAAPPPTAARRMGLALARLRRLIRTGVVLTCPSGRVPISEIEWWNVSRRERRGPGPRTPE